jgi:aquaporin Z
VVGDFAHYWVYLVGPLAGALIAVGIAWILRGPGGDAGGIAAAQGRLDPTVLDAMQTASGADPKPPA